MHLVIYVWYMHIWYYSFWTIPVNQLCLWICWVKIARFFKKGFYTLYISSIFEKKLPDSSFFLLTTLLDMVDPRFNEYGFKRISLYIEQNLSVPSFLTRKTLIQNLGLTNIAFNEYLVIWNKNIGFHLKFYGRFSEQNHIFDLRSLFATFESLKSVKFPMHALVRNSNSKHFHSNVGDNYDSFKSLQQSDLDELKLPDPTLVPEDTTAIDFTDANQTLSLAEPAISDGEKTFNH